MEFRRRLYFLIALLLSANAQARVLMSQKDALTLAFPDGANVERRTAMLTDEQTRAAEDLAQSKLSSRVWTYYAGATGTAYFESHKVRTMNETFMVVVNPDGTVRFIEILSFAEPDEYQAPKLWLKQFKGRPLDGELLPRRGLRNITGASITSDAVTQGVRRILAVHQVLNAQPAK